MGMSASQARLLSLTRRMSDVEYQGQQINQQRTTLSNQVNALYNSLLEMDVPVPPATNDYQKIVYTGKLGATEYSFEANSVVPKGKDSYSIVVAQKGYGNTISATTGFSKVENTPGFVTGMVFSGETYKDKSTDPETEFLGCTGTEYTTMFVQEGKSVRKATTEDFAGKTTDGKYKLKEGVTYITTAVGDTKYPLSGAYDLSVDGKGVFTFEALEAAGVDLETIAAYKEAILPKRIRKSIHIHHGILKAKRDNQKS